MEIKYFETFQLDAAMGLVICDKDTLKNEYRRLAMILHPDKGGSDEHFRAMKAEYEYIRYNLGEFKQLVEKLKVDLLEKDKQKNRNYNESEKVVVTSQSVLIILKHFSFLIQGIKTLLGRASRFHLGLAIASVLLIAIFIFGITLKNKNQEDIGIPDELVKSPSSQVLSKHDIQVLEDLRRQIGDTSFLDEIGVRNPKKKTVIDNLRKNRWDDASIVSELTKQKSTWRITDLAWSKLSPSAQQSYLMNYNIEIVPVIQIKRIETR